MEKVKQKIVNSLLKIPNVVGVSNTLKNKITKKRKTNEKSIRVYVKEKVSKKYVPPEFLIPEEIDGIKTDVVAIGEPRIMILNPEKAPPLHPFEVSIRTEKHRPLVLGISIGNYYITAGTLGAYYRYKGEVYLASNYHVFGRDVSKDPQNENERTILQPGPYDIENAGGDKNDPEYVVGSLEHYKKIHMVGNSNCSVSKAICSFLNGMSSLLGRKTRFVPIVQEYNKIDFALAMPFVDYDLKFVETDYNLEQIMPVGVLFAGSDKVTIFCKLSNIQEEFPGEFVGVGGHYYIQSSDVDKLLVRKIGRTTGYKVGLLRDESATVQVAYGWGKVATFNDVAITDPMSQGGDSGSLVWVLKGEEYG